jgi:hypothetical protein
LQRDTVPQNCDRSVSGSVSQDAQPLIPYLRHHAALLCITLLGHLNDRVGIKILAHGLRKTRVLLEQKKIKFRNKRHLVENKTELMQQDLKVQ